MSVQKIAEQLPALTPSDSKTGRISPLPTNQEALYEAAPFETSRYPKEETATWLSKIYNLLLNMDELSDLLHYSLQHGFWLNAYLLSAGMNQILEDYLHPDPLFLSRIAKYLASLPYPVNTLAVMVARAASQAFARLEIRRKSTQEIQRWQLRFARYIDELAELAIAGNRLDKDTIASLVAQGESFSESAARLPAAVRSEVMRIPSCFRSFDQLPEDLVSIIQKFSTRWSARNRPIAVIGVRTSGSYLAPLYAAILKAHGYQDVKVLTLRPNRELIQHEQHVLRQLARGNGLALLCDDPPISGASVEKTAFVLERVGFPLQNIILLLQLFGKEQELPDRLKKYPSVLMPWSEWAIHQLLSPDTVAQVLSDSWKPGFRVVDVMRLPSNTEGPSRQHTQAIFRVKLAIPASHRVHEKLVLARGIGLGYFGEHALAIAQRLPAFAPNTIAFKDGLLYQEILPPTRQLSAQELVEERWINHLARYILVRNQQLAVKDDIGLQLKDRNAVWEVASYVLSKAFGRGWLLARLPLIDPYIKNVLQAPHPSVIDGDMALCHWYERQDTDAPLLKMSLDERDFSHSDLYSFDPVYDLASLAIEIDPENPPSRLRQVYESISGEKISPERWMLYQLVHLWDLHRLGGKDNLPIRRWMAQALQRYYSEVFFHDLEIKDAGPQCAIDIDGVLETSMMNFPTLTQNGAMSLRALALHGYRVILATGRSLGELKARCKAYSLPGGVAEYGSVIYDHRTGQVFPLLTEIECDKLSRLRSRLSTIQGVHLDPDYSFSVRAFRQGKNGQNQELGAEMTTAILQEANLSDQVYAIPGKSQTDFVVSRVDKGSGLKAWLSFLQNGSPYPVVMIEKNHPLEFAIGDSASDLPMFALAKFAFSPANASLEVKRSDIKITTSPYQRGLSQAVTQLLGHKPGGCPVCQLGSLSSETSRMLAILSVQEKGGLGIAWQAIKLAARKWK